MNPNRPSLVLYFTACLLVVVIKLFENDSLLIYVKSIIVPLIFIYYFITNNYKISWTKMLILLFCFVGDIFNFLNFDISPFGALLSFLIVNLLLLKLSHKDFKKLKFDKNDRFPMLILIFFTASICITILSLNFDKMQYSFSLYVLYGMISGFLIFVSLANYIKKPNYAFLNMMLMVLCSMVSDIFFIIDRFYLHLFAFSFIQVSVQVFSYYFMVNYFIANDKFLLKRIEI